MLVRRVGRPGLVGLAARTAVVAGTATAVSGSMQAKQQKKAQEQQQQYEAAQQQAQAAQQQAAAAAPAAQAPAPPVGGVDVVAELQKLASLKEAGVLSDEEFAAAKAKLLG